MARVQCVKDTIHRRASQICLWPDVPFVIDKYGEDISEPEQAITRKVNCNTYDSRFGLRR